MTGAQEKFLMHESISQLGGQGLQDRFRTKKRCLKTERTYLNKEKNIIQYSIRTTQER